MRTIFRIVLCCALIAGLSACASQQSSTTTVSALSQAPDLSAVPGWRQPRPGLYTAGQPDAEDWKAIADTGVTTVINLRTLGEMEGRDEAADVEAAGMRYVNLPIAGPAELTEANAAELWRWVTAREQPLLVHCASGNRVGALLALGAARYGGMTADAALSFGESAGLTRLAPVVRERLGLPEESDDASRCAAKNGEPAPGC